MTCTLTPRPDGLALASPYDPLFVIAFKVLVPASGRAWDPVRKVWVIDPAHADDVANLCGRFFGEQPTVPALSTMPTVPEIRTLTLEYLGQCKLRDLGAEPTAMGYANGAWSVIAPESVLKAWFDPFGAQKDASEPTKPAAPETLYGLLGVAQDADETLIKAGYRRMARQWHPDACREPDAAEMFIRIKAAYDVLSDPLTRRKYNAGLLFERQQEQRPSDHWRQNLAAMHSVYRAPLRCGLLVVEALPRLGRLTLTKILAWNDITDGAGRVMVSSWDADRERIKVAWVQP
jgi:hypothetical protein